MKTNWDFLQQIVQGAKATIFGHGAIAIKNQIIHLPNNVLTKKG